MNYLSLYKAHFKIDINEKELYDIRFHSPNTLHFKVPIHNKESFLYLNNELLILIEQIHVLNSKIIKKRNKIKTDLINTWELSHSLVQEILLSNEIEGVVSTRKEINELLDMKSPKEYRRLYGMVNKYRDIFFQKAAFDPIMSFPILHINNAVRFHLLAHFYNLFHDLVETCVIRIDRHFLHHKADICIVDSRDFFDRIFHFCCTVCTIQIL